MKTKNKRTPTVPQTSISFAIELLRQSNDEIILALSMLADTEQHGIEKEDAIPHILEALNSMRAARMNLQDTGDDE